MLSKILLASFVSNIRFAETTNLLNDLFSSKVFHSVFVSSNLKTSEEHPFIRELVLSSQFTKVDKEVLHDYVKRVSAFYDNFVTYNNDKSITLVLPYSCVHHTGNVNIEYYENTLIFSFYKGKEEDFVYAIKFV